MNLVELRRKAMAASKEWDSTVLCGDEGQWLASGPIHEQQEDAQLDDNSEENEAAERDSAFISSFNPKVALALLDRIDGYEKALRFYAEGNDQRHEWTQIKDGEKIQQTITINVIKELAEGKSVDQVISAGVNPPILLRFGLIAREALNKYAGDAGC